MHRPARLSRNDLKVATGPDASSRDGGNTDIEAYIINSLRLFFNIIKYHLHYMFNRIRMIYATLYDAFIC